MPTFNEITNPKKYVRVLRDTYADPPRDWMIGKEGEVSAELHYEGEVVVEHEGGKYCFNRSDVAFLTPIAFKGRKIAVGDWVVDGCNKTFLVIGYVWDDDGWALDGARDGDLDNIWVTGKDEITSHIPHHPQEDDQKMTDEDLIAELKRRGRIKNGEIID